ncbi:MAG: pantoate--beta-alanine ligase [Acutalibacteraceae bacterium]|nr:pantoate--beta-alanine ligase [Acutalibacteraceae bacterium]
MKIVNTIAELREIVKGWKKDGLTVGLVPTMGYLHEGHASLIKRASQENDRVVVSDFVNPIQFGPKEDLASYPRDIDRDAQVCEESGADVIFHPTAEEMYCPDFSTFVDITGPSNELCGKSRPTHFKGVCTVVSKLFLIVAPHKAYFGQKDAQQLAVIKRMVRDLNFDIEIIGCPIIREDDGLAKSSRNTYLSPQERQSATILNKALTAGKQLVLNGETNTAKVIEEITNIINSEPLAKIDYVQVVSFPDIKIIEEIKGDILTAIAVYIGTTRLIDNFIIENGKEK